MIAKSELDRIEASESDAHEAYRKAKAIADVARADFANQRLKEMGVAFSETICLAPKWAWSKSEFTRVVVLRTNAAGMAICRPVTKSNKPHEAKIAFGCDIKDLKIEATQ